MYKLEWNQVIRNGKGQTYWYLVDENGKTLDKATLEPYRGKNLQRYAMNSFSQAQAYLDAINKQTNERINDNI